MSAKPTQIGTMEAETRVGPRARRRHDPAWHLSVLVASVLLIAVLCVLDVDRDGALCTRVGPQLTFPTLCLAPRLFGVPCPACGLTRSVTYLVHGQWADSFRTHRLGGIVFLAVLLQIPYRSWRLTGRGKCLDLPALEDAVLGLCFALLVINWIIG